MREETLVNKEYDINQYGELGNQLRNITVDENLYKEKIYRHIKYKLESGTLLNTMKEREKSVKKNHIRKTVLASMIALVCLVGGFSATAYGQEIIQSILAQFHVGKITITQYDKSVPKSGTSSKNGARQIDTSKNSTIKDSRMVIKVNFEVPAWLPEGYQYTKCVLHSEKCVELVFAKGNDLFSLLITSSSNGIDTSDKVDRQVIAGKDVYFANGIVLWEQDHLNYELYQMGGKDFDHNTLEEIMKSMTTGPVKYDTIKSSESEVAGPAAP